MNSWLWIHTMNSWFQTLNSYLWIHSYEFRSIWIHDYEFMISDLWIHILWIHRSLWIHSLWIHSLWIHSYEFIYFWIHIWIHIGQWSRCWPNWSKALPMCKLVFTVVQLGLQSSIPFEPSRATKSGSRGWGFEAPFGTLKRQQWLGSPFNSTSRVTLSRSCFAAGRLLI